MTDAWTTKVKVNTDGAESVQVVCPSCARITVHAVVAAVDVVTSDENADWDSGFQIIKCNGCERFSFREFWCHPQRHPDDPHALTEHLWPNRVEGLRHLERRDALPPKIARLYGETFQALSSGQPVLAATGLRGLIEGICKDKQAPGRNLAEQIDGLVELGVLAKANADTLHRVRFLGNSTVHELEAPETAELEAAQTIVHNLLETVYVVPMLAARGLRPAP